MENKKQTTVEWLAYQKSDFEKRIKEYEQLLEAEKKKYEQLSQNLYSINTELRADYNDVCENNLALRTENTFYKKIIDKLIL